MDKLTKLGEQVRKAFESKPKETPVSDSTQKAIAKAVGPRFQATPKKVEPAATPIPLAKEVTKKQVKKRTKKGPTKY